MIRIGAREGVHGGMGAAAALALVLAAVGCSAGDQHAGHDPQAAPAAPPTEAMPTTEITPTTEAAPVATQAATPATPPSSPLEGGDTAELRLGLNEWSIETGGSELPAGQIEVVVTNAGGTGHDVVIHGRQGSWASPVLDPGERHTMTITVVAGEELELVCTLVGHHAQGMHTTLTVAADS